MTGILFDQEGEEITRVPAILSSTALQGGQSASFRTDFPGTYAYARAEFEVAGDLLRTEAPDAATDDDGLDPEP